MKKVYNPAALRRLEQAEREARAARTGERIGTETIVRTNAHGRTCRSVIRGTDQERLELRKLLHDLRYRPHELAGRHGRGELRFTPAATAIR